ncbi:MAG: hypothetical protein CR964_01175 [Rhodobacterales bacterium]|nr:MAG: hypothetical protein CR964_01175 [Rhodobacterales bacterium]
MRRSRFGLAPVSTAWPDTGKHCVFYHCHHIVWSTRYRYKVQREFPAIRKRYWGRRFWGRGTFQPPTGSAPKTSHFRARETHTCCAAFAVFPVSA